MISIQQLVQGLLEAQLMLEVQMAEQVVKPEILSYLCAASHTMLMYSHLVDFLFLACDTILKASSASSCFSTPLLTCLSG